MSVKFNYAVDLEKLKLTPIEKKTIETAGVSSVFEGLFTGLLTQKYPDGVQGSTRKSLNRVLRKLDESENSGSVELEAAEVDLLKEVFNTETKVPASAVRLFSLFEEEVDKLAKEAD